MTPEVHTEGGEFRLDIVDDAAICNERRWRIVLRGSVLQIVLFDDAGNESKAVRITRQGTQYDIIRGGELL